MVPGQGLGVRDRPAALDAFSRIKESQARVEEAGQRAAQLPEGAAFWGRRQATA